MLSKGLLPLKSVLFLAMSLPVQCMSFFWSWSSIRWASSPVHQNKYLCCFRDMTGLMWLQAGTGGQQWPELWEGAGSPSDSAVPAVTALLCCCMGCLGSVILRVFLRVRIHRQFWNKNHLKLCQELGWWEVLPSPKNICSVVCRCWCLLRWGQSAAALLVAVCPGQRGGGGAVPRQGCVTWHCCVQDSLGSVQGQELGAGHERLGSLPFCFRCLLLASDSPNSLSLLCCWNRHFHRCLQPDPLSCPNTTRMTDELRNQSVLKLIGRRWSGWFF